MLLLLLLLLLPASNAATLSERAATLKGCMQGLKKQLPSQPDPIATVVAQNPNLPPPSTEDFAKGEQQFFTRYAATLTDEQVQEFCGKVTSQVIGQAISTQNPSEVAVAMARAQEARKQAASGDGVVRAANSPSVDGMTFESVFDTPYTTDLTSGLFQPHAPEYDTRGNEFSTMYDQMEGGGIVPDNEDNTKPPIKEAWFGAIVTCSIFDVLSGVAEATCDVFNNDDFEFIPKAVCIAVHLALLLGFETCQWVKMQAEMVDRYLDGQTAEAVYQNGIMAMQNQLHLYDQTKKVFDDLEADLKKYTDSLLSRQCKAENDVANVQREANYVRRLILTPEEFRPGWNTPATKLQATSACTESCSPRPLTTAGCITGTPTGTPLTSALRPQTVTACSNA